MKLIIAEKPMLARAIASAIPGEAKAMDGYTEKGGYMLISAFGHLLELKEPEDYDREKYGRWSLEQLPIFFEDWGQKPSKGKEERLELIGRLLGQCDSVIHAGDPDDEGQYLIDEILDWFGYKGKTERLYTADTTKGALTRALSSMDDNDLHRPAGLAARARSVADIMVGYNLSRYFSLKNPHVKLLTVGRVQTPALGLVVARDRAIEEHVRQGYYTVCALLEADGRRIKTVFEPDPKDPALEDGRITDRDYAEEIASAAGEKELDVTVEVKSVTEQPPLPFNLVKLQTYCDRKFGYDPTKTLEITQSLRDVHSAITYNRSDCQYLSEEQYKEAPGTLETVKENIRSLEASASAASLPYDSSIKSKAFDDRFITAHTAIIPQNRKLDLGKLTEEERNVYLAVAKYYLAQFLPPAEKERTSLEAPLMGGALRASSTRVISKGYTRLVSQENAEAQTSLSGMAPGKYSARCMSTSVEKKETKAPPRYTKASLNEDMTRIARYVTDPEAKRLLMEKDRDKKGENGSIGTSATRSYIIDNLEARGFIETKGRHIISTALGRELIRILPEELVRPDMTGLWWAIQESVKEGTRPWTDLTDSVMDMIRSVISTEYPKVDAYRVPASFRRGLLSLGRCPRCGSDIVEGEKGFGCMGYKNGCSFIIWKNAKSGMMRDVTVNAETVHELLKDGFRPMTDEEKGDGDALMRSVSTVTEKMLLSPKTGSHYKGEIYLTDGGEGYRFPPSFRLEKIVNDPPVPLGKCPRCGRDVIEGRDGFGCSGYADGCRFIIWKKAKSGMMSRMRIGRGMVRNLLSGGFTEEASEDGSVTLVSNNAIHSKKLWSDTKETLYEGDVALSDRGASSPYGASFVVRGFSKTGPEILGKCPRCGSDVTEKELGFSCSGYREGCRFSIWKHSKMKLLKNVTFTKTDAKRFLSGKSVRKKKLVDKKGRLFTADIVMVEREDDPYGPVYRVVAGTIDAGEDLSAEDIVTETVDMT